jgi:hypothetical protein
MDDNLEDVRREVENTRFALADKIERLENKIETTATRTLNPAYYVRTRPWPTLGVCAFLGWVVGRSLQSRAASTHLNKPETNVIGHLIRTFTSAAASVAGVAAGDFIRDSLKERKTKHST